MRKLTTKRKVTAILIALAALLCVLTITNVSHTPPVVPAALGALCGHGVIPNQSLFRKSLTGLFVLLGIGALFGLWSVLAHTSGSFTAAHNWLAAHAYYVVPSFCLIGGALWGHGRSTKGQPKPPKTHRIIK